jgi:hypothetical protein
MDFEVIVKKIHINHKLYSQNSNLFIVCINHNRQHNDGWKSSMNLKLVTFTTHVVNAKLLIAINHSIFKKIENGLLSKFCKLYFVSQAQVQ